MSASASNRPTTYKKVAQWQVNDYMAAIEQYNRPFKSIVRRAGDTLVVPEGITIPIYDPPYPPWIDVSGGGIDNVFDYQLDAYNTQLQALKDRRGNMSNPTAEMVEILNRPPVPRMPPRQGLVSGVMTTIVENTPRPAPAPAAPPPPAPAAETNAAYNARLYRQLYEDGRRMYSMIFPQGSYEGDVAFEPPTATSNNYETQEAFFELYDKLRELWATVKGDEPFFIVMPRYRLVAEAFRGSRVPTREGFLAGRTCAPYESYLGWFFNNSTVRTTDREQMKIDFCAGMPNHEYIPGEDPDCAINCYLKTAKIVTTGGPRTVAALNAVNAGGATGGATGGAAEGAGVTTSPPSPALGTPPNTLPPTQNRMADGKTPDPAPPIATAGAPPPTTLPSTYIGTSINQVKDDTKKYKYNWFNFDQSADIDTAGRRAASYNKDNYNFEMSKKIQYKVSDIQEYYNNLTAYNDFWLYKYGWRDTSNRDRPYNPPMPIWLDPEDEPVDKVYIETITTYNDKVKNLLRNYTENSPTVRLPDDFRPLPEPPAYPSLLKDLLTNPRKYADKQQGGSEIPVAGEGSSYTIPTAHLLSMLQAARDKLYVAASTSSSAAPGTPGGPPLPKCPGGQCKKYNDYVPDFVRKYFDDQAAKTQQKKVQSGFADYAFSRPGPSSR